MVLIITLPVLVGLAAIFVRVADRACRRTSQSASCLRQGRV